MPTPAPYDPQADMPTAPAPPSRMIDNPWIVLGLLFLVMAALGIPVLWMSRAFSRPVKVILSVAVSLYTLLLLWGFWMVMVWCYRRISGSL